MKPACFPGGRCTLSRCPGAILSLLLAAIFLLPSAAFPRSTAEKIQQAEVYYERAKEARQALEEIPAGKRARKDYERVIQAFRRVYYTAPAYQNDAASLTAIGELYRAMARSLDDEKYFHAAIEAYEYLLQEYPHSRYRFSALLTIAEIYRDDLEQLEEALGKFQLYLEKYPRSGPAEEARQAVAQIGKELAAREKEFSEASASVNPRSRREASGGRALLTNIRHWATPNYTRVVIDLEREVKYRIGRLSNPERIYFDLQDTQIDPAVSGKSFPVEYGLLKHVRVAQNRVGVSRVVLDLGELSDYSVFELPNPYRLVIDIRSLADEQPAPPKQAQVAQQGDDARQNSSPSPEENRQEASASPVETAARIEPSEGAGAVTGPVLEKIQTARPNRDGSHSLIRALGLKIGRIMIDPGHGGHDTGTIGPAGLREKDLVLDVAQRLGQLVGERLGSEVLYTREADVFVPLESRTAVANEKQADLFISIHANSSRSQRARGIETYYLNFTTDAEALEVAARENAVSQESIYQLQNLVQKIALQEKIDESREFATSIQSALWQNLGDSDRRMQNRGVKKAPFVVLIGANMPSILAEISFLSNPQDEKLLRTEPYRQKIAEALYAGIVQYVDSLSGVKVARTEESPSVPTE